MSRLALFLLLTAIAPSCRATSVAYRFTPSPLEALVQEADGGPIVARVLVGIPGAERRGRTSSGIPELLVRIRIENKSPEPLRFDPERTVLVGSDLAEFGAPSSVPPGVMEVPPGAAGALLLRYPFPRDGSLDAPLLTGVNLQFELGRGEQSIEVSVSLERNEPGLILDPGPTFTFGTGFYYGGW